MSPSQSNHRSIIELARPQFGVVTRRLLLAVGCSGSLIDRRLNGGLLWPVFRGVYVVGRPAERRKTIWKAATLAGGRESVLGGLSSGGYWGIVSQKNLVQVNRPHGRKRVMAGQSLDGPFPLYLRTRTVDPRLVVSPEGIPVLSIVGTLIDLAAVLPDRQLESAVSEASRLGHLRAKQVEEILDAGFAREGIGRLRECLRWWTPESVNVLSVLEAMFQRTCQEHGIEMPKSNRNVCGLKVDFVWPRQRVVVETDGFAYHGDRVSFQRDHERQSTLARGGYLRLSFTYWQVMDTPDEVAEAVLAGLTTWKPS